MNRDTASRWTPPASDITVAGFTHSSDFPTTPNALRSTSPPPGFLSNAFVTQFESSQPGSLASLYTMLYSTYLGADTNDARDDAYGVTLDAGGLIVVTGRTQSADFPMTMWGVPTIFNRAPYLKAGTSGDEPYLVKIDPALNGDSIPRLLHLLGRRIGRRTVGHLVHQRGR